MRQEQVISVSEVDRVLLGQLIRGRNTTQKVTLRAKIIVLSADMVPTSDIVKQLSTSYPTITRWRQRYAKQGVDGLRKDAKRPGRTPRISEEQVSEVVHRTLHSTPLDATHWSIRTMAAAIGLSRATIHRIWQGHGLKPHRSESFKLSADPKFKEKLEDVVGVYLNPPARAIVYSVDEKSQIQALDRTQPGLPMKKGRAGTMTHDYKRNGTTTLFAALNVATGEVIGECYDQHRHNEFLAFIKALERRTPKELDLHLILDNYGTHNHPAVRTWLADNKRVHLHFTPTSASWLNLVERFFGEITRKWIRRGVFKSVAELKKAIFAYLSHHNEHPRPYVWTATVEKIMAKLERAKQALETVH